MRAFVAVTVPSEVALVLADLERPAVEGLRWTKPEQWHVSLRFLGEVADPGPVRDALTSVPARLAAAAGNVDTEAVLGPVTAWFPGRRVLQAPVRGLDALAACVVEALTEDVELAELVDRDRQRFNGHLTLARMGGRRPGPARLAGVPLHAQWRVHDFALVSSALGPGGSRYEEVATFALAR